MERVLSTLVEVAEFRGFGRGELGAGGGGGGDGQAGGCVLGGASTCSPGHCPEPGGDSPAHGLEHQVTKVDDHILEHGGVCHESVVDLNNIHSFQCQCIAASRQEVGDVILGYEGHRGHTEQKELGTQDVHA